MYNKCLECGCPLTSEEIDFCSVCSEHLQYVDKNEYIGQIDVETDDDDE